MAEKTLDIFWLLKELDKKNYDVYSTLTDQQKKEVSIYMLTRWMYGTSNVEQLCLLGSVGTACVFTLDQHPDLMLKLLAAMSKGGAKRYKFVGLKSGFKESMIGTVISAAWDLTAKQAKETELLLSSDDIMALAIDQGYQDEDIKKLKKELDKR